MLEQNGRHFADNIFLREWFCILMQISLKFFHTGSIYGEVCIDFGNGLFPVRYKAITWIMDDLLLIGPSRANFSEIRIKIWTFPFKKMLLKVSSAECRPFCSGFTVLNRGHVKVHLPSQCFCVFFILIPFDVEYVLFFLEYLYRYCNFCPKESCSYLWYL